LKSYSSNLHSQFSPKKLGLRTQLAGKVYFIAGQYDVKLLADIMSVGMWFLRELNRKQRKHWRKNEKWHINT